MYAYNNFNIRMYTIIIYLFEKNREQFYFHLFKFAVQITSVTFVSSCSEVLRLHVKYLDYMSH